MKVSVNILCWNNEKTIGMTLLNAYNDVKDLKHEFIIVDNGSKDNSCDIISNFVSHTLSDNYHFIRNKENLGISVGKNTSVSLSKGEYILFLDGDVVPVPNSIILMLDWLDVTKEYALGMYPNKFVTDHHIADQYCKELENILPHECACLFYGIYRRELFKLGLRMCEDGEMGGPGYGWEDHDFYMRLKQMRVTQYAADINNRFGRYYHNINSSIRAMGREKYVESSRARAKHFHEVWDAVR